PGRTRHPQHTENTPDSGTPSKWEVRIHGKPVMDMDRTKRTASKPRSGLIGGSRDQGQPVVSAGGAVLVLGGVVALARFAAGGFQVGVDDGGNVVALPH